MSQDSFNITPQPQVLVALTNTPLKPLDAICELVDNSLDSFAAARNMGNPVSGPWVQITIPGLAEVNKGEGRVRIADNGIGLDKAGLQGALTAGLSGKNKYDTLGLFGMGFNIATGKLGKRTEITTCRLEDDFAIRTVLDLTALVASQSFELEVQTIPKPSDMKSGTIVEISGWWPAGSSNAEFIKKLASISKNLLAEQLGRRYATILRKEEDPRIQVFVNDAPVKGFEHCVWGENRFVERQGWGRIPAVITFDNVLNSSRHCINDATALNAAEIVCPVCKGTNLRTIQERVRGWVGIQRFDDTDQFGIDIIRNGRAIRVAEKDAFFSFEDNLGVANREYPIDSQYGRIVGEVHLDHLHVDYTKQDFARTSDEWTNAILFVRGKGLQEKNWEPGYKNDSPIGQLFKGYRKVRKPGRDDLYMGKFDSAQSKAVRVSRDVEREFYAKFQAREKGYYDDAMWWKQVEEADTPELVGLVQCPKCQIQVSADEELCDDCGYILKAKQCINCESDIQLSAVSCGNCGESQIPEVTSPWACLVCIHTNSEEDDSCGLCGNLRGTEPPCSTASLSRVGNPISELSFANRSFTMPTGFNTGPLNLEAFSVPSGYLVTDYGAKPVGLISDHQPSKLRFFLDLSHSQFALGSASLKTTLSYEIAQYLTKLYPEHSSKKGFTVSALATTISGDIWPEKVADEFTVSGEISEFFAMVAENLLNLPESSDFFKELTPGEQTLMTNRLISRGVLDKLNQYKDTGDYLAFVPGTTMSRFNQLYPEIWDLHVWKTDHDYLDALADEPKELIKAQMRRRTHLALDVCAEYSASPSNESHVVAFVRASLDYLLARLK